MATKSQNCPECGRRLQILGHARPGKRVVCPQCGIPFSPAGPTWLESSPINTRRLPWIKFPRWAMAAALFLVASIVGGGLLFGRSASATSPSPSAVMVSSSDALAGPQSSEAVAFKDPNTLKPEDVQAAQAPSSPLDVPPTDPYLDAVAKNVNDAKKAIADQQANNSEYMRLMNQATVAMFDGRYDDARSLYLQALERATDPAASPVLALNSGDPFAPPIIQAVSSDMSRDSQAALEGLQQANYLTAMVDGDAAMRDHRYADAVLAFQAALRLRPNDPDAASGLAQAHAYSA